MHHLNIAHTLQSPPNFQDHLISRSRIPPKSSRGHHAPVASTTLPFLSKLDESFSPAICALEAQEQPFAVMRSFQAEILGNLQEAMGLSPVATRASSDGLTAYNTGDSLSGVVLQVGNGSQVRWFVASATSLLKFKGGTIRVNVFPDDTRVLPKLDVELFYFFGQINMYINLAARSNLVLDEEYLDYYYKRRLRGGQSLHDLQLECMAEPELSPFQSRSIDMRVLTGQTSLFYKASASPENVKKMTDYGRKVVNMWLELAAAAESDGFAGPRLAALPRYDAAMFGFVRKDPDNEKVVDLFGHDAVEEMIRLQSCDPAVLL